MALWPSSVRCATSSAVIPPKMLSATRRADDGDVGRCIAAMRAAQCRPPAEFTTESPPLTDTGTPAPRSALANTTASLLERTKMPMSSGRTRRGAPSSPAIVTSLKCRVTSATRSSTASSLAGSAVILPPGSTGPSARMMNGDDDRGSTTPDSPARPASTDWNTTDGSPKVTPAIIASRPRNSP